MNKAIGSNIDSFASELSARAVEFRNDQFQLRAGGLSHWYVDLRSGLSEGRLLAQSGKLMVEAATEEAIEYNTISAIGVGGQAVLAGIAFNNKLHNIQLSWACDKRGKDQQGIEEYGLHAEVRNKKVWVVDDIATTGDSLITLIDMVRRDGGTVENASVVADRSKGNVALALQNMGISFHTLLNFNEETGKLVPSKL